MSSIFQKPRQSCGADTAVGAGKAEDQTMANFVIRLETEADMREAELEQVIDDILPHADIGSINKTEFDIPSDDTGKFDAAEILMASITEGMKKHEQANGKLDEDEFVKIVTAILETTTSYSNFRADVPVTDDGGFEGE